MSSSEEDEDYTHTNAFSEDNSDDSGSSEELNSEASESDAEFTDSEEEKNSKKTKAKKTMKRSKVTATSTKKKEKRSRFLDTEAQVGDETDDDDEGSDEFLEDFIANEDEEEEAAAAAAEIRARRPMKNYENVGEVEEDFDAEAEERRIRALYGRVRETTKASSTSSTNVPRPFLLPTVTDPKLWLCKAQQGRERSAALALLRVIMERQFSGQPLHIFSIIARDGLKGYVYIEAHKPIHISQAIEVAKLNHCLYPGQAGKSLVLVPLAEMPQVLQTTAASGASGSAAASAEIPDIGAWVRVKRGRYSNDLAQVVDNAQDEGSYDPTNLNTCIIRLKLLPRLNFALTSTNSKDRAPPRLFDPEEASRYGPVSKSRGFWIFGGETYRDGFLFKNIRLSSLSTKSVAPSPEELARFPDSDKNSLENMSGSSDSIGNQTELSLAAGDQVIVMEGEMKNLQASVDSLEWRPNSSTGRPEQFAHLLADASSGLQGESARFTIKVAHLRKIFSVGAQVRIISGPFINEIGIVVAIDERTKNLIVFASGSNKQFNVPAGICVLSNADNSEALVPKSSSSSGSGNRARSNDYSLYDLVQFEVEMGGEEGVGVVIRILDSENSVAVFDSLGQIRNIPCRAVSLLANYNDSSNSYASAAASMWDSNFKQGDRVIEKTNNGFYKILHIYKSLVFVRPLSGVIPSGSAAISVMSVDNISKPRSAPVPSFRPGGSSGPGGPAAPVGHLLGKIVSITGGPQKGYIGFVKQVADNVARVELHTNGKIISVSVNNLALASADKNKDSNYHRREESRPVESTARTPAWNSASGGGKTPGWNAASSSGAKTPGWNSGSSRTPGWNSSNSSSKTPAWNASSSARTPAWNPATTPSHPGTSSARTPAWTTTTGMTPAWNVPTAVGQSSVSANWQKGTTPAWNSTSARTPAWSRPSDEQESSEDKEKKEKQPWGQVNNWKKD